LTIRTFFQPDEYYQSLEPAWKAVFGYGELTWEWKEGIRGFLYPTIFAPVWWALKSLGVQDPYILVSIELCSAEIRLDPQKFNRESSQRYAITGRTDWQGGCSIITLQGGR
jgi:hypothetical protein